MAGGRRKSNTVASKQKDAVEEAAKDAAAEQAAVDAVDVRGDGGAAISSDEDPRNDPKNVGAPRELLERRVEQRTKERDAKEKENAALKRKIEELEEQMKTAAKVINFSKDSIFNIRIDFSFGSVHLPRGHRRPVARTRTLLLLPLPGNAPKPNRHLRRAKMMTTRPTEPRFPPAAL